MPGTRTELIRGGNGFSWVLLFNTRAYDDSGFFYDMDTLGWNAIASITTWPANDLFDATLSYAAWQPRHFTPAELADQAISGDGADPDGDGLPNLVEYALGLDPKVRDSARRPSGVILTVNGQPYLGLIFRRLLLAHEVDYTVEVSSNLVNWLATTQQVGSVILNADGFQTVTYRDTEAVSWEQTVVGVGPTPI